MTFMNPDNWSLFSYMKGDLYSNYSLNSYDYYEDNYNYRHSLIMREPTINMIITVEDVTLFIERPNCSDLVNVSLLNPIVRTAEGEEVSYVSGFNISEEEKKSEASRSKDILSIEEISVNGNSYSNTLDETLYTGHFEIGDEVAKETLKEEINSILKNMRDTCKAKIQEDLKLNPNIYEKQIENAINASLVKSIEIVYSDEFNSAKMLMKVSRDLSRFDIINSFDYKQVNNSKCFDEILHTIFDAYNDNLVSENVADYIQKTLNSYGFHNAANSFAELLKFKFEENIHKQLKEEAMALAPYSKLVKYSGIEGLEEGAE